MDKIKKSVFEFIHEWVAYAYRNEEYMYIISHL